MLQYEVFLHLHFFNKDFVLLQFEHFSGSRVRAAFLGTGAVLKASLTGAFFEASLTEFFGWRIQFTE